VWELIDEHKIIGVIDTNGSESEPAA